MSQPSPLTTPALAGTTVPFLINNAEVLDASQTFDVVSPETGLFAHKAASATSADVDAAVAAAEKAFTTWRKTLPRERRDIFLRAAEIFERRREELIGYMMTETGARRQWAELNVTVSRDMTIDVAGRVASLESSMPTTQDPEVGAIVLREPFGVVLAVAPW